MHEKYDPGTYLVLANVLIPRDCDTAEKILRDGMKQFPSAAGFHLLLGHVHQSRGHHAEAFYEYQWELLRTGAARTEGADAARRCAELVKKPSSSRELADLMTAVQEMQRNPQLASEMLAEMIRKQGEHFILQLYEAKASQNAGNFIHAADVYRALILRDPGFVPAYVQLSELLRQKGDLQEAEQLLTKAREIDDQHWRLQHVP